MNKALKYFYIACAAFLFLAFFHWPYDYYRLLRIVIFAGAASIAYNEWHASKPNLTFYILIFLIIAIVFNPFFPIYLKERSFWRLIDIFSGFMFVLYLFRFGERKEKNNYIKDYVIKIKKIEKKRVKIILTKILLTIAVIVMSTIFQALISESELTHTAGVRLIPGMIFVFGIILIWTKNKQRFIKKKSLWLVSFFITILLIKMCNSH